MIYSTPRPAFQSLCARVYMSIKGLMSMGGVADTRAINRLHAAVGCLSQGWQGGIARARYWGSFPNQLVVGTCADVSLRDWCSFTFNFHVSVHKHGVPFYP